MTPISRRNLLVRSLGVAVASGVSPVSLAAATSSPSDPLPADNTHEITPAITGDSQIVTGLDLANHFANEVRRYIPDADAVVIEPYSPSGVTARVQMVDPKIGFIFTAGGESGTTMMWMDCADPMNATGMRILVGSLAYAAVESGSR